MTRIFLTILSFAILTLTVHAAENVPELQRRMFFEAKKLEAAGQFLKTDDILTELSDKAFVGFDSSDLSGTQIEMRFNADGHADMKMDDTSMSTFWGAADNHLCGDAQKEQVMRNCDFRLFKVTDGFVYMGKKGGVDQLGTLAPMP